MNILFLTPKSDIAYIFENETLRQTLEKMDFWKFTCIPILNPDGKYVGTISEVIFSGNEKSEHHGYENSRGSTSYGYLQKSHLQTGTR